MASDDELHDGADNDVNTNNCAKCNGRSLRRMVSCGRCMLHFHGRCVGVNDNDLKKPYVCNTCNELLRDENDGDLDDDDDGTSQHNEIRTHSGSDEGENARAKKDTVVDDDLMNLTADELRERVVQLRAAKEMSDTLRNHQRESMSNQILQLMKENGDAMRRNAKANDRHQKQIKELQRQMEVMRLRKEREPRKASDSEDEAAAKRLKASIAARKKAAAKEVEKMEKELASLTGTKRRSRLSIASNVDTSDDEADVKKSSSRRRSKRSTSTEFSAVEHLATTMRRQFIATLPEFDGDLKGWPMFEATYKRTTIDGGFNDRENIERLSKALKGDAKDAVANVLMFSNDASKVMKQLRKMYGQPERVIVGLMNEIMAMKAPRDQPEHKLSQFAVKIKNFVASAKAMELDYELDNEYVLSKLAEKIHPSAYREWTKIRLREPDANIERFADFLMERVRQTPPAPVSRPTEQSSEYRSRGHGRVMSHQDGASSGRSTFKCLKCERPHDTAKCFALTRASLAEREEFVRQNQICRSCLNSISHQWRDCPRKLKCGTDGCRLSHHPLLHDVHGKSHNLNVHQRSRDASTSSQRRDSQERSGRNSPTEDAHEQLNVHKPLLGNESSKVLFKVVPITLIGNDDTTVQTFALLDGGSSITLLEEELFDKLHLEGKKRPLTLQWTGELKRTEDSYLTTVSLRGVRNRNVHKLIGISTVKNLALPSQTVNVNEMQMRYKHLRDIPLNNMIDAKPQLLIGIRQAKFFTSKKIRTGGDDEPVAIKTDLGWIVFGSTAPTFNFVAFNQDASETEFMGHMTVHGSYEHKHLDHDLHETVKDYFSTENFGVAPPKIDYTLTDEEKRANNVITKTMKFKDRRAEIGLLWRHDDVTLPDSYPMAMRRLISQEKALKSKPELLAWTNEHINDMVVKGHARIATDEELCKRWKRIAYIPGFTIVNANKIPPKPRFVMDFAAKFGPNGTSVNSELLKGPDNLASMMRGLCKFREQKVAVNADVKEMFPQIKIIEDDQQCQRFLWRFGDTAKEPTIFILQVMAFGPKCSPSSAQAVKNTHAEKYRESCPNAVEALVKTTYVDDYLNSHPTVDEAVEVSQDAIKICADVGFPLVNFQSSHPEVLAQLPQTHVKQTVVNMDPDEKTSLVSKILGMYWEPETDCFTYKLYTNNMIPKMLDENHHPTKREILKTLMKVFDPLGLISHYLIRAKILMQEIWRDGTGWDEPINVRLLLPWREWVKELQKIDQLKIARQYAPINPMESEVELIVFVDASETAFAATAYFRFNYKGDIYVAHAMAKTKVAPLKMLTIPKLELQAGVLGVRVDVTVKNLHSFPIARTIFISDARAVLAWIVARKLKLKQFVASRVSEILDSTTRAQWFHIASKHNVADDGTKCADQTMGNSNTRWFRGPEFLRDDHANWPITAADKMNLEPEILAIHRAALGSDLSFATHEEIKPRFKARWNLYVQLIARFMRITTYRLHKTQNAYSHGITPEEFERAENLLFRKIQWECFPEEVSALMAGEAISKRSTLLSLTPMIDSSGVMRLKSRAQRSLTSYAARNPALLPNKHELVDLMIQHYHEKNFHIGEDTTIADIRERAWIVKIRSAFKRVKSNCVYCRIRKARPQMPMMGLLPPARLDFTSKPFTHVGVDCFGPYEVKYGRGRVKRWIMIFTCLTFRAVHLEMLNDMSTDECLSAIRRFQTRRGRSLRFYSDCGTNFVGAANQLKKDVNEMREILSEAVVAQFRIKWEFNPAHSPWRGGAWERLISSIKKCIDFIFVSENPREDILRNALYEAEARMNARPLTHTPVDPEDEQPLTPNTALFGSDAEGSPLAAGRFTEADSFSRSSYRRSQLLADRLFSRWIKEYLPTITRRSKWFTETKPANIDDLAILIDPSQPRDAWKLGRLTALYPGPDGRVRSADIKLKDGTIKKNRSIGRLAILDLQGSLTGRDAAKDGGVYVVEP